MPIGPAVTVQGIESLRGLVGPGVEPVAVSADQVIRDRRPGLFAAERVAPRTLRLVSPAAAARRDLIDGERITGRLQIEHPVLDARKARPIDRFRTGAVPDARIQHDFRQRRIQAVPVQPKITARPEIPQRNDVGGVDRAGIGALENLHLGGGETRDEAGAPGREGVHPLQLTLLFEQLLFGLRNDDESINQMLDRRQLMALADLFQDAAGVETGILGAGEQEAQISLEIERCVRRADDNGLAAGLGGADGADMAQAAIDAEPGKTDRLAREADRRVVAVLPNEAE